MPQCCLARGSAAYRPKPKWCPTLAQPGPSLGAGHFWFICTGTHSLRGDTCVVKRLRTSWLRRTDCQFHVMLVMLLSSNQRGSLKEYAATLSAASLEIRWQLLPCPSDNIFQIERSESAESKMDLSRVFNFSAGAVCSINLYVIYHV